MKLVLALVVCIGFFFVVNAFFLLHTPTMVQERPDVPEVYLEEVNVPDEVITGGVVSRDAQGVGYNDDSGREQTESDGGINQTGSVVYVNQSAPQNQTQQNQTEPIRASVDDLPGYVGLGLFSEPMDLDWMVSSGIDWDYRSAYLSSGVNTGQGWATWNAPAGDYVTRYLGKSKSAGYVPVFSYYMLAQSAPHPVDGEPDVNLNTPATMKAYFEDWKLLMQKAGAAEEIVIVHVEPDLWGYMQKQHGADPKNTRVAVAASGFGEAAGFPNDARGFAQMLEKMRDDYAPNVLLAWHASNWATGYDVVLNKEEDPVVLGSAVGDFYLKLDTPFDLVFFDLSDRTAGYFQYVVGEDTHWWNETDFVRFREYVKAITVKTNKKVILWQVPIGNTVYKSMDNTVQHYQDNKVQYFLEAGNRAHMEEYARVGVIGIIFGAGTEEDTSNYDAAGDGITNPPPVNGNTLDATVADDDGGFLRWRAAAYYADDPVRV